MPEISEQAIREQLERILASRAFTASSRMSRFLRFAVEMALEGRNGELKEYVLGVEIFDRNPSFDPRVDPIVRVEARRLRAKLKSYYASDGRNDELVIDLPTGAYAPRFHPRGSGAAAPAGAAPASNIAVLPFANLSPEPDSEYFSDGLTEELIHALTKVVGLRVVAWSSAAKLKDRQLDFGAAGRELNVGSVLTGSVRRAADRLRVIARLVDTTSGQYLWSETYDRQVADLFSIQEEISRAIAASLRLQLLGRPAAAPTVEAYDLYLRGRYHWNRRTPDSLNRAIQLFQQAISADPAFAPAHSGLADAHSLLADFGLAMPGEVMPAAKASALRAIELDPTLAEPHASLGLIESLYEWNWTTAGLCYRRSIELNPSYVTAHHWYACDYLALLGRFEEAVAEMETALRLDPLSNALNESLGYTLMLARRYDDAIHKHQANLELDPHYYKVYTAMGRVYIQKAMYGRAVEMLEHGRSLGGEIPNVLGALGQAYALDGRHAAARSVLDRLTEMSQERYVPSTTFALIHCGLGEKERALDWLEKGCGRRELSMSALGVHPAYDPLREQPRFQAIVKRIGVAT